MLEIVSFTLGPAQTNAYLVADSETKEAAVIDPAWDGHLILAEAQQLGDSIIGLQNLALQVGHEHRVWSIGDDDVRIQ